MGAFWGGGWGYGCGWGGNNDITINRNNTFNRNANVNGGNRVNGGESRQWRRKWELAAQPAAPRRRPLLDRATANRYGGTARGDSMNTRQANARQNPGGAQARQQSAGFAICPIAVGVLRRQQEYRALEGEQTVSVIGRYRRP